MSVTCALNPTATHYSQVTSVRTRTLYETSYTNGTGIVSTIVTTATRTQAVPVSTDYASVCSAQEGGETTTVNDSATTSTKYQPTSTATLVSASTRDRGGGVVLVTSYSTMSATSVYVIFKTSTHSSNAINTGTAQDSSSKKSPSHAGPIAGGIVAAVILLALLGGLFWFFRKRSRTDRDTRALDDFFKDALNPGDAKGGAAAAAVADGTTSTRRSMRRRSSLMIDLEKEKRFSSSNDEGNWAALTRMSSLADDDNGEAYRRRSQSRQSLNGISRAVSMHSTGPEAAYLDTIGWDGMEKGAPLVEEPEAILDRVNSGKSMSSLQRSPYSHMSQPSPMIPYDGSRPNMSRIHHLSSRSSDLLPKVSPGMNSLPGSPDSPYANLIPNDESFRSSAPNTFARQSYHGNSHHMSISSVYAAPAFERTLAKARSFSTSSQQVPERPRSALGIMAISQQASSPNLLQQQPHQWSPPSSPRNHPVTGNRIQARASVHGYNQFGPFNHWSPPLAPHRVNSTQQQQHRPRPQMSHKYSSDYPPSRYSHLDVVDQSAEDEVVTNNPVNVEGGGRQRSLSGGMLLRSPAIAEEGRQLGNAHLVNGGASPPSSSSSTMKKKSLSIRNASPEESTDEEGAKEDAAAPASMQAYHEKMVQSVSEKVQPLLSTNNSSEAGSSEDVNKKQNFWLPQGWLTKASS